MNQYLLSELAKLKTENRRLAEDLLRVRRLLPSDRAAGGEWRLTLALQDAAVIQVAPGLADALGRLPCDVVGTSMEALVVPERVPRLRAFLRERRNGELEQLYVNGMSTVDTVVFGESTATITVQPYARPQLQHQQQQHHQNHHNNHHTNMFSSTHRNGAHADGLHALVHRLSNLAGAVSRSAVPPSSWSAADWFEKLANGKQRFEELSDAARADFEMLARMDRAHAASEELQKSEVINVVTRMLRGVEKELAAQRTEAERVGENLRRLEALHSALAMAVRTVDGATDGVDGVDGETSLKRPRAGEGDAQA